MSIDDLAGHQLVKLALENIGPLLKGAQHGLEKLAEKGEVRRKGNAALLEYEFYDYEVFHNAGAIINTFERLGQSQRLIEAMPDPSWQDVGLDRHTWIEYHYGYYVITLVSLADIALVLTNGVFRLGNRERDCKLDLISRNSWVAQTPAKQALEGLAEIVKPHRMSRNLHVHRGRLQSIAEVMGSKLLDQLQLFSFVQRLGKPTVDGALLDLGYKGEISKISETLDQERARIGGGIIVVFDVLLPVYKQRSEELHQKWQRIIDVKSGLGGKK